MPGAVGAPNRALALWDTEHAVRLAQIASNADDARERRETGRHLLHTARRFSISRALRSRNRTPHGPRRVHTRYKYTDDGLPSLRPLSRFLRHQMSAQQPVLPPLDGSVSVLPGLIDFHAQRNPYFPWVVLASEDGARVLPITFLEFAEATHRIAYHFSPLDASLGRRVVCLLLACDSVLYVTLIAGLTRAGLIVRFYLSTS